MRLRSIWAQSMSTAIQACIRSSLISLLCKRLLKNSLSQRERERLSLQLISLLTIRSRTRPVADCLINVCAVAISQCITWIDFDCLAVVRDGAPVILPEVIDIPAVVVESCRLLRVEFNRLVVISNSLIEIPFVVVRKPAAVVSPGKLRVQFDSLVIVSDRAVVVFPVIVDIPAILVSP